MTMPCASARAAAREYAARHSADAASAASRPTMSTASAIPMLRSWPSVALVDGVKMGSGSRSAWRRPPGMAIPWTVPSRWYSLKAEPAR